MKQTTRQYTSSEEEEKKGCIELAMTSLPSIETLPSKVEISKEQIDVNMTGRYCKARWNDWGFFIDDYTRGRCFVWHFKCHTIIRLPRFRYCSEWETKLFKCVVTPSTYEYFDNYLEDDYFCTISLFFNSDLYCLICRPPFYKKWEKVILHDSSLPYTLGIKVCQPQSDFVSIPLTILFLYSKGN